MSEQAPRGDLGGNAVPEMWQGLTRQEVEVLADGTEYDGASVYLEMIDSDSSHCDADIDQLSTKIDGLLRMFDVDTEQWYDNATMLVRSNKHPEMTTIDDIRRMNIKQSAGKSLFHWASHNLLIEDEEAGGGRTELVIILSENLRVTLVGEGDHWSGSHYKHPQTGKVLTEHWDDDEILELERNFPDIEPIEYEVGFSLKFKALFSRPDAEDF